MVADIRILNGNELIVQGAKEAGFNLYTGYPGSPLADFFNILHQKRNELKSRGIHVVIANSEANAAAMASGAKMAGQDTIIAMKSMGLHVASDALSVGNFANPGPVKANGERPSVVVVVGDDPWSISTSTPADSRFLFKHLHMSFLEPATPQELKDWIKVAKTISAQTGIYQGLLLTTFMAEGGGRVECFTEEKIDSKMINLDSKSFNLSEHVMVPPNSLMADKKMIEQRFPKIEEALAAANLDRRFGNKEALIGVIAAGAVFETLKQFLEDKNIFNDYNVYKLASSYPLVKKNLAAYLSSIDTLIVVEEKRGFLEAELQSLINELGLKIKIYGKKFDEEEGFPAFGGIGTEIIASKWCQLSQKIDQGKNIALDEFTDLSSRIPLRLPTFCPGCPHRETLSLLKDLRKTLDEENIDLISHGDVGCYSLSFLPPFKEMHDLSAMGQGGALAAGTDLFTENPSVVLMGDSTFFHSGIASISNSVQCGHNITYILLDNDNTAMTGHQMTPSSSINVEGDIRPKQRMLEVTKTLGVNQAFEVNPSDRYFYRSLLRDVVKSPGTKVIVSNKECGLTYHGRKKREDRKLLKNKGSLIKKTFYQINTSACEDCRVCIDMTGCPGLTLTDDAYGSKMSIDPQICVSDSYCTMLKACPSFEKVVVNDYHPTKYQASKDHSIKELPLPQKTIELAEIASGKDLRIVVIGVGGSGVTTISKVLSHAALDMEGRDDIDFKFVDQKGLAQRNGSVASHLSFYKKGQSHAQANALGSCDLVLSPDLLEGLRAAKFLAPSGKLISDEDFQVPLTIMLDTEAEKPAATKESLTQMYTENLKDQYELYPFKNASYEKLGRSVYASTMILGLAFQKGLLPFSLKALLKAISSAIPEIELDNNLKAFNMGREMALSRFELGQSQYNEFLLLKESIIESCSLIESKSKLVASFENNYKRLEGLFPQIAKSKLAWYIHDQFIYDRGEKLENFFNDCKALVDLKENQEMALRILAKCYFVKDEVFVSHQMISPMKRYSDEAKYKNVGRTFDVYHINRPEFDVFNKKIAFDMSPRPWMFKLMRHFRILRSILKSWHSYERKIAKTTRERLLEICQTSKADNYKSLKKLDNIKGYRDVRYAKFKEEGLT